MITPGQLHAIFPACRNPGNWCRVFEKTVDEFDLQPNNRLAMWLAQTGFESMSFNVMRERMSYQTVEKLRAAYPHEFPTNDVAQRYIMNPTGLANFVYANKNGNGNVASGDGFKYRGGGLIELTGRGNFKRVGEALQLDLELRPLQIEQEATAARTAGFFWKQNDLNAAADDGDFDYTTKRINGSAMHAAAERKELWKKLAAILSIPAARRGPMPAGVPAGTLDGMEDPNSAQGRSLAELRALAAS